MPAVKTPRPDERLAPPGVTKVELDDPLPRIAAQQKQVVEAVGDALDVVGEVVDELRTSVAEDERVRQEVRDLAGRVRSLERIVRVALYVCSALVFLAVGLVVATSIGEWQRVVEIDERTGRLEQKVESVESTTASTLRAVLAGAEAHAKSVEAEVALTPEADREALAAAIDAQEEVAEAQIEVAAKRHEAPSPKAHKALQEAREKKARLNGKPPRASE